MSSAGLFSTRPRHTPFSSTERGWELGFLCHFAGAVSQGVPALKCVLLANLRVDRDSSSRNTEFVVLRREAKDSSRQKTARVIHRRALGPGVVGRTPEFVGTWEVTLDLDSRTSAEVVVFWRELRYLPESSGRAEDKPGGAPWELQLKSCPDTTEGQQGRLPPESNLLLSLALHLTFGHLALRRPFPPTNRGRSVLPC